VHLGLGTSKVDDEMSLPAEGYCGNLSGEQSVCSRAPLLHELSVLDIYSEKYAVSIFRVEYGHSMFLRNVIYLQVHMQVLTALQPKGTTFHHRENLKSRLVKS
jgi:hypothetical protein